MEKITLTTPIVKPNLTNYTISEIILDWENSRITIQVKSDTGEYLVKTYEGNDAKNKMTALNKANLSVRSLNQRVFDILIADGVFAGNVTGTVD